MGSSFMKTLAEDSLDAVDFRCDIARREAGDIANRGGVLTFQVKQNDLSIERSQRAYQGENPLHRPIATCLSLAVALTWHRRELIEADQRRRTRPSPSDLRCGGVVSHAVRPGPERTTAIELGKAPPQGDVNVLQQVTSAVGVGLVCACQPLEGRAKRCVGLLVEVGGILPYGRHLYR